MERELPTVKIGDTNFVVDIQKKEFRELEHPSNSIPFNKIYLHADDIAINYDKNTRNVYEGDWLSFVQAPHTELVHLPPLIDLDRFGVMGNVVNRELEEDADLLLKHDKPGAGKSLARALPKMEIEGTHFFLDMRLAEFRKVDNPLHRIPHSELFVIDFNKIGLIYDPHTKLAFSGTHEQFDQRTDLRLVALRNLTMVNADTTGIPFKTTSYSLKQENKQELQGFVKRKGRGI